MSTRTCHRIWGLPVIPCPDVGERSAYRTSNTQVSTSFGTLTRSGLCSSCDAAVYADGSDGKQSYYHAVPNGLVKKPKP